MVELVVFEHPTSLMNQALCSDNHLLKLLVRYMYDDSIPLAPLGARELEAAKIELSREDSPIQLKDFDLVVTSPYLRTRFAARQLFNGYDIPIILNSKISERPFGKFHGYSTEDIRRSYPQVYSAWDKDPVNYEPIGGLSMADYAPIVLSGLDEIINMAHGHSKVAVFTHRVALRVIDAAARGVFDPNDYTPAMNSFYVKNMDHVRYSVVGNCRLAPFEK
jgi:broad specificity phosphatase PhoE